MDVSQFDWLSGCFEPARLLPVLHAGERAELEADVDDDKREPPELVERVDPQTGFVDGYVR